MLGDMSTPIIFVTRDGGGTAPVELTVAAKLREHGHDVRAYGPPEVQQHAERRGFDLQVLHWPAGLSGPDLMARIVAAAPSWSEQVRSALPHAGLVVADCAAFGVQTAARAAGVPVVSLMPTVYVADLPMFHAAGPALDAVNALRRAAGLTAVASLRDQLLDADRLLVLTSRAFDDPGLRPPANVRHVGPQLSTGLDGGARAVAPTTNAGDERHPLVLISLSTGDQGQRATLQRVVDAVAALPVRVLVTTGPVDPDSLRVGRNVTLTRYVPHEEVLSRCALVVTHAGHGTVMAAVSAGVPLVCVPMGLDQPAVAALVARHGLGLTVGPAMAVETVRAAVERVLHDPRYRARARRMSGVIEPPGLVVREIEALLPGRMSRPPTTTGSPSTPEDLSESDA